MSVTAWHARRRTLLVRCLCSYILRCQERRHLPPPPTPGNTSQERIQQLFSRRQSERWKDLYLHGCEWLMTIRYAGIMGIRGQEFVYCTVNRISINSSVLPRLIESEGGRAACCGKGQVRYSSEWVYSVQTQSGVRRHIQEAQQLFLFHWQVRDSSQIVTRTSSSTNLKKYLNLFPRYKVCILSGFRFRARVRAIQNPFCVSVFFFFWRERTHLRLPVRRSSFIRESRHHSALFSRVSFN